MLAHATGDSGVLDEDYTVPFCTCCLILHCCSQLILQGCKTQNQNDNHVLRVNLHSAKSFISSVTMETAKICSFTSHLHDMQNILATAVLTILAETPLSHSPNKLH